VIAPIMTEPGGPAWRQTTFFPFSLTSRLAAGNVVAVPVESGAFTSSRFGEVAAVNAVATVDDDGVSLFLVNRSVDGAQDVRIDLAAFGDLRVAETHRIHDADRNAANTLDDRERVRAVTVDGVEFDGGVLALALPPISWTAIRLA